MRAGNDQIRSKKKRAGCLRNPPSNWIDRSAQSVQRRSARILIWSSEAAVKDGSGLLTTL